MFREIRRKNREISADETKDLLRTARRGILAMNGDDGYPYAIPINYLFCEEDNRIYFHGSRVGYKQEALNRCDKVCFTVYGNESAADEAWAPFVRSAVIFGRCRKIENTDIAMTLIKKLAMKYYPDETLADQEIAVAGKAAQMFEIEIEHLSGKQIQEK